MPEDKIYGYIYKIINDFNDKIYVGQTSTSLEDRFARHCRDKSSSNQNKESIDNLIQTIGKEHFQIIEIEKGNIWLYQNRLDGYKFMFPKAEKNIRISASQLSLLLRTVEPLKRSSRSR